MSVHNKAYAMISIFLLVSAVSALSSCGYVNQFFKWKDQASAEKITADKLNQCPDTIGVIPELK